MKTNYLGLFIYLGLLLLNVSSCSRMIIEVSTADLVTVHTETENIRDQIDAYAYASVNQVFFSNTLFDKDQLSQEFEKVIATDISDSADTQKFMKLFETNVQRKVMEIKNAFNTGLILTEQANYSKAKDSYLMSFVKSVELEDLVSVELENTKGSNFFFDQINILQDIIKSAPTKRKDNLLGDPLVSYITKNKNDHIWKSKYNKTKSWTSFGNSDIAVVLTEDPDSYNNNYTIKGVRVDADKLIQSSFDVLAQSINVLASSQGIPISEDTKNNYFAPTSIPAIQQLPAEESKLKENQKILIEYQNLIILEILNKGLDSKSGDELITSINEIKLRWNDYREKLESRLNK